jgi:ribonuclease HII
VSASADGHGPGAPPWLSIARIQELLAGADVSEELISALSRDPRRGVARAVAAHARRQAARTREAVRLAALYERETGIARRLRIPVGGTDEVGRGPLAGPVLAACVVIPAGPRIEGLDDSKALDPGQRERLDREIRRVALGIGIGSVEPEDIDRLNIRQASILAMERAVEACRPVRPGYLLVDALRLPGCALPQEAIIRGDATCAVIAAASIVAKVARDRLMVDLDRRYPGYGFARHKGYGTEEHLERLRTLGASPIHRRTFAPVNDLDPERCVARFRRVMAAARTVAELADAGAAFRRHAPRMEPAVLSALRREYARRRSHLSRTGTAPEAPPRPPGASGGRR